jgi:hypothetical protein
MALSPLEYELLLRCAGKRSLADIETELFSLFGGPYQNHVEFHEKLVDILYQFNFKYWLTHFIV